ncbi:laminin G Domain protein [Cellvibrio zantedeschiae]|uniref:Laminin G Domain protein n=1 Tax=Cellvibrio zantedeschiae TaxID=1237077 RepID=A0ABQ3ASS9_9GAMM|nr:LamG domain-containing protein [Cellvibrio zantedeschiae]GGY66701.1 laminin G Domain protein [Cellvibrio zantedeschiae]
MNNKLFFILATAFFAVTLSACNLSSVKKSQQEIWRFDSLTRVNGYSLEQQGQPKVVDSPYGKAVSFDGDGDRLLVNANPLGDANEFTIEIVFKPNDVFPKNHEPRIFHIESADNPNRRITIELRLNDKKQWYFDAFIKSDKSQFTLIDPAKVHPVGEWAHAAMTFKNREFISYVNGEKELTGQVDYLTIPANAKTSVGARMNQIHWFNGEILQVRVTRKALLPEDFVLLGNLKK